MSEKKPRLNKTVAVCRNPTNIWYLIGPQIVQSTHIISKSPLICRTIQTLFVTLCMHLSTQCLKKLQKNKKHKLTWPAPLRAVRVDCFICGVIDVSPIFGLIAHQDNKDPVVDYARSS